MRAIISVSNKTGLVPFATRLAKSGVEIISTGGTAKALRDAGLTVIDVSDYTGFPEIMDGRVKTLHPKIYGGLLAVRDDAAHMEAAKKNDIEMIDIVVVNLYPFEETAAKKGMKDEEVIEQIDIGGPSMLRASAKNFAYTTVVTDPMDYERVASEIESNGSTTMELRRELAWKVYERTAAYDRAIGDWFREKLGKPEPLELHYEKVRTLRYGENPHQKAAFFRNPQNSDPNVTNAEVLHGKELSFNNIVDANSALELVKEFQRPSVVFMKHNNPCGVASANEIEDAFDKSFQVDTQSAFGSVVALNRPVTKAIAEYIASHKIFIELIICPSFEPSAFEELAKKPNIRLLETGPLELDTEKRDIKKVAGGVLVQTANTYTVAESDLKVVTKAQPTPEQVELMLFANKVCKHVMSNAVVFAKKEDGADVAVAIGAGQMSRVDSVYIASKKGGDRLKDTVMASDAFFPFPDALEAAVEAGATAIIQPGGSVKDSEVIAAADSLGISMVVTGIRMFRH